ncbi:hypothetical protein [Cytobacillus massiliigabonensis]|nr:hypothetical protein [Cytobacillus massiliigabonensis]
MPVLEQHLIHMGMYQKRRQMLQQTASTNSIQTFSSTRAIQDENQ